MSCCIKLRVSIARILVTFEGNRSWCTEMRSSEIWPSLLWKVKLSLKIPSLLWGFWRAENTASFNRKGFRVRLIPSGSIHSTWSLKIYIYLYIHISICLKKQRKSSCCRIDSNQTPKIKDVRFSRFSHCAVLLSPITYLDVLCHTKTDHV